MVNDVTADGRFRSLRYINKDGLHRVHLTLPADYFGFPTLAGLGPSADDNTALYSPRWGCCRRLMRMKAAEMAHASNRI